ncbi:MAG: integrase arm-type DNA-binding domain-containing protein [Sulfurimonadaceae bacterium]
MSKIVKPLSDTEIKKAKINDKNYKLSDGHGLYLLVQSNGTKLFRFDFTFEKKRNTLSFGTYPKTSLKEAREKREIAREQLKNGINPSVKKAIQEITFKPTFKEICEKWLNVVKSDWEEITYKKNLCIIENNAYPFLENKPFEDIERIDILNIIEHMQNRGITVINAKLLGYLNRIWKYAVTYNIVEHNIIADIDKKQILKNVNSNKHYPTITNEKEIKQLLQDINNYQTDFRADISTVYALKIAPYVALRPYNLRFLEWSEIDLDNRIIKIPKEKMKTKKDFVLPISDQVFQLLNEIKQYSYHISKYVFPSQVSQSKPISDNTLTLALKRMGYKDKFVPHGFRAMFSTIAHEKIQEHGFSSDIIESCLAHAEKNKIKAAYNRDSKMKYFDEKKSLFKWWNNWLSKLIKNYITQ